MSLSVIMSSFNVELDVQRYVHCLFEGLRVDTEYFHPGDPNTESFHNDGSSNLLWKRIQFHSSVKSPQLLDIVLSFFTGKLRSVNAHDMPD